METYDVIIIGGGYAGVTAAAVLASEEKKSVLLLEQASQLGGRAVSFRGGDISDSESHSKILSKAALSHISERSEPSFEEMIEKKMLDGYVLESGVRANWRLNRARVSRLMDFYNKSINWYTSRGFVRIAESEDYIPLEMKSSNPPKKPEWMTDEDFMETVKVVIEQNKIANKNVKEYDHVNLRDWLSEITDNEKAIEWHNNRCTFHTVTNDPALNSVGEDIRVNQIYASDPRCTVDNGYWGFAGAPGHQHVTDNLVDIIELAGGKIMKSARVQEVIINGGKAEGVIVMSEGVKQIINASSVICTVRPHEIPEILPIELLDEEYQIAAERSTKSTCLSCYMGMNKSITDFALKPFNKRGFIWNPIIAKEEEGFKGDVPLVGVDVSAIAPTRSPEGKHLIGWAANIHNDEATDKKKVNLIIDRILEFFDTAFPDWKSATDWTMFIINHGALIWRLPEDTHPDVISRNIKGLYFAGESYGKDTSCQGTEGAVQSALFCVESITGNSYRKEILGDIMA
ncbi:MAG: FAD-dependent oxidoreductase [Clostridiales bacterium]